VPEHPGNIRDGLGKSTGLKTLGYIGCAGRRGNILDGLGQEHGSKDPQLHWVRRKSPGISWMALGKSTGLKTLSYIGLFVPVGDVN